MGMGEWDWYLFAVRNRKALAVGQTINELIRFAVEGIGSSEQI